MEEQTLTESEQLQAEQNELDSLIQKGFEFTIGKRKFVINEPYLATLDRLSNIFIKMEYDLDKVNSNLFIETKIMASQYSKYCALVIAIAVLNSKWKIRLFSGILAKYFYWNIKPSKLLKLVDMINLSCNLKDFIRSIILMSAARTTKPNLIEQNPKG